MNNRILILSFLTMTIALGTLGYVVIGGKKVQKIGVVDNAILLSQFSDAIDARHQLDEEKSKWKKNLLSIEDSAKAAMDDMTKNYNSTSKDNRQNMEKRLQHWNQEFARYSGVVDRMSIQKEQELLSPVIERLNSFVRLWAEKRKFDIIIGTGNGGVILSANQAVNVTGSILEELNKTYGKTGDDQAAGTASVLAKDSVPIEKTEK